MKTIENINDVLAYILEGMYETEKKIQQSFPGIINHAGSESLKDQLVVSAENAFKNRLRLKRIFSYLLTKPRDPANSMVGTMLNELYPADSLTHSQKIADVLLNTALRTLTCYRLAEYTAARDLAIQLNLQTAINLLDQIIEQTDEEWKEYVLIALTVVNQRANFCEA